MRELFKQLLLIILVSNISIAIATEQTYVREYTYKASDLDSRVSARNNTLKLIKAGVLDEIISYVNSSSRIEQAQTDGGFRSSFIQRTSTNSAGFVRARILDESWDGFELWMQAEIKADPVKVRAELERALAMQSAPAPTRDQTPNTTQAQTQAPPGTIPIINTTADYSGYMRAAQLAQVIALLQPLKITMSQYYSMNGEWPSSLEQINLEPEQMTDGQYLDKVRLGDNGRIIAYLSDIFGRDRILSLLPKSVMGGMHTRWDCVTNLNMKTYQVPGNLNCTQQQHIHTD